MPLEDDLPGGDDIQFEPGAPSDAPLDPSPPPQDSPAQASPPPEVQPQSVRDIIGSLGYNLPGDVPDDYNAILHLARQAQRAQQLEEQQRQADVYTQLGRQLAPQASRIQQALGQPDQPQRNPWEPPKFDPRWAALVKQDDATGRYVAVHPNISQSIVDAANDYGDWMRTFMENPATVIQQAIKAQESTWEQRVEQIVQQRMAQQQTQQQIYAIAQQNATWAYAKDDQGQFLPDPINGGYKVSPVGQQYIALVREAAQLGVSDPVARDRLARMALRHEIAEAMQPPQADAQAQAAARQGRALPGSRPRINPLQSLSQQQRSQTPGAIDPDQQGRSLRDRLHVAFDEEGIQDQHIAAIGFGT